MNRASIEISQHISDLDAHMRERGHTYWCGEQDAIGDFRERQMEQLRETLRIEQMHEPSLKNKIEAFGTFEVEDPRTRNVVITVEQHLQQLIEMLAPGTADLIDAYIDDSDPLRQVLIDRCTEMIVKLYGPVE